MKQVVAWMRSRDGLLTLALSILLFVGAFALYARTMAPGLLDGDEGEFQINIYRLGVSHTGYPLFFMLGKLFTLLVPVGSMATRANLYVVFWSALAVVSIFVFLKFLTGNRWIALICALLFAVSRVEWSQSIIPRPYTLNSLFVVLVVFFFFLWRIGQANLVVPIFIFGLSMTNHRTMIWFAPAIALFVLIADYRATFAEQKPRGNLFSIIRQWLEQSELFKPRRIMSLVVAFILPLFLYGYVFWRGDSDVGVEFHLKDFNDMILGGNANRWMRYGPFDWLVSRVTDLYIPLLIEQFTPLGFIAGLIGMVALALNRVAHSWPVKLPAREALLFIVLANIGNSIFCVFFWTMDVEKFFLPSYITFLFLTSVGLAIIWDWLVARLTMLTVRWAAQIALVLLFVGTSAYLVVQNYSRNDFSAKTDAMRTWQENLSLPLERNALIVGNWESLTPLEYARYVDNQRADLERWKIIIEKEQLDLTLYGSRQQDIEREVRAGRPVYLTVHPNDTETLSALSDTFRLTRMAGLWRVLNLPPQAQTPESRSSARFTDSAERALDLIGYSTHPSSTLHAGDLGLLTLFWRIPQPVSARFTISFRLMDSQDRMVYQRDLEPASGMRPTIGWAPNEVVSDDIGFFIPPDASPGPYRLEIVVYDSATGENLSANGIHVYTIGQINVR
ncbi:MAG: DUF2723 domain-containing protein [Chloroflexi bacterium]|nr:DUF2723 domain-containing protein [Chloroflexota bacterium]